MRSGYEDQNDFTDGIAEMPSNTVIEAVAYELPTQRITSESIEQQITGTLERLAIPLGNLEGLTGIQERRFWDPGVMPSEVATLAARKVIDLAGIDPQAIGCIINTSVSKDFIEPSVACLVHGNLKLSPHCRNYDIGNACLGFLDAMLNLMMMIDAGMIQYGLVVDGESAREPVEATIRLLQSDNVTLETYHKNFATLTIGSGAVAMLLTHKDLSRTNHIINGSVSLSDTKYNRLSLAQRDGGQTDAPALLVAGVNLAIAAWKIATEKLENWSDETIDIYIPHQVSVRHMNALNTALGLTPQKVFLNVQTLGNIGPAALPITLKMADESGRIKPKDHVALLGIGSGLNCTGMSVTW